MDVTPAEIADAYMRWIEHGDLAIKHLCSPVFHDNVSGMGRGVFDVVGRWFQESFSDRKVEHHLTVTEGDRTMVWFTLTGVHVGNGFPRMVDLTVRGKAVAWPQVHILRIEKGQVLEHWAVRDDLAMLDSTQDLKRS